MEIPTPVNEAASPALLLGDADGDRAADLAVYDSPYDPPLLLTGGADTPSGLSDKPQRLPAGESVAFGDFDGDGRRDIAVGQSFVDPYDEEETPYRRGQVRIAYGKEPGTWVTVEGGAPQEGFGTRLGAGDFDGDGCDDLAVQLTRKKEAADARFAVLHGGSDHGLASEPWRTVRRTVAEPSGPVDDGPRRRLALRRRRLGRRRPRRTGPGGRRPLVVHRRDRPRHGVLPGAGPGGLRAVSDPAARCPACPRRAATRPRCGSGPRGSRCRGRGTRRRR